MSLTMFMDDGTEARRQQVNEKIEVRIERPTNRELLERIERFIEANKPEMDSPKFDTYFEASFAVRALSPLQYPRRQQVSNERKTLSLDEKFAAVADISPAWERVKHFTWADLTGMRDRIATLTAEVDALKATNATHVHDLGHLQNVNCKLQADNQRVHENYVELECKYEAEVARLSAPVTEELYEDGRCQVCGWPLSKSVADGCVPESCSMRPREGSEDWFRLKERRAWLAARATPPQDVENGGKQ